MSKSIERAGDNGLCVNCDDRRICRLHRPGQQILFCEEYRLPLGQDERRPNRQISFSAPIDFGIKL